jgi:gamma-glutamyltranspeptidase/glutathione hydrolase
MTAPFPISEWGFQDPRTIHAMTEAERRVYADRATHLGDPDYYQVPVETLLDQGYIKQRMADFSMEKASRSEQISAGKILAESEQTTHFSIVDASGNAVAVTTTLNGSYGSKLVIGGAGFFMNNEMDDFSIKAGVPNMFGLIGGEANAIEGGKRMLSSMTPTIVTHNGELFMVTGTPGGATIITSVYQNILNVIDHGMSMQGAVEAPRFHHQWLPEKTFYEKGTLPLSTIKTLEDMGHTFDIRGSIGRVDAIRRYADGSLEGGADPRGDDASDGY